MDMGSGCCARTKMERFGSKEKTACSEVKEAFPEKSTSSSLSRELLFSAGRRGCDKRLGRSNCSRPSRSSESVCGTPLPLEGLWAIHTS